MFTSQHTVTSSGAYTKSIEKLPKYSRRSVLTILRRRILENIPTEKTKWGLEFLTTSKYRHSINFKTDTISIEQFFDDGKNAQWMIIGYYKASPLKRTDKKLKE